MLKVGVKTRGLGWFRIVVELDSFVARHRCITRACRLIHCIRFGIFFVLIVIKFVCDAVVSKRVESTFSNDERNDPFALSFFFNE